MHHYLGKMNEFPLNIKSHNHICYPFLIKDKDLRLAVFHSRVKYSDPVMDKWSQPDGLLDALNCVRSEPESTQLEAAFQCVLNKVSVEDLMMQALAAYETTLKSTKARLQQYDPSEREVIARITWLAKRSPPKKRPNWHSMF